MHSKTHGTIAAVLCLGAVSTLAQSAWVPAPGEIKVTPGFSFSTFDEFWMGRDKNKAALDDNPLNQYTGYLALEYGILPDLAADATIGYSATDTDTQAFGPDPSDDGLADTFLGLRYRVLDEGRGSSQWLPTIALRAGAVIAGTYDSNQPFSAGDGAHAFEGSVLVGKAFGSTGFGLYGDIGYRVREHPVPDDIFGSAGIFQQLGPVTLAFGYRHIQAVSGLNIEGTGFDPGAGRDSGFPALREVNQLIEGGVTFTDNGNRSYQVAVGRSVAGRNTGDKFIIGFNVTIPFGGR